MSQLILPLLPSGSTEINDYLSVKNENGYWYYFVGINPIFSHEENDLASFRMFTSQLIVSGQCRNIDIIKAFGVSPNSVKRGVKKYKKGGIKAFFGILHIMLKIVNTFFGYTDCPRKNTHFR